MENPIGAGVTDGVPEGVLRSGAALQGKGDTARPRAEHAEHHEGYPLRLGYARNPFDFHGLFLQGFREWGRGLDARISGKRLPDARLLGLFTTGFRTGALRLLLIGPDLSSLRESDPPNAGPIGGISEAVVTAPGDRAQGFGDPRQGGEGGGDVGVRHEGAFLPSPSGEAIPNPPAVDSQNQRLARVAPSKPAIDNVNVRHSSLLSRASIAQPIGFDVLSLQDGFLQAHLLFLAPERRGRGLCGAYFDAVTRLARESGHRGFCFLSTLPKWRREEYPFNRRLHMRQADGTEVWRYWRTASEGAQ